MNKLFWIVLYWFIGVATGFLISCGVTLLLCIYVKFKAPNDPSALNAPAFIGMVLITVGVIFGGVIGGVMGIIKNYE